MTFIPYHQHLLIRGFAKKPFNKVSDLNIWFIELVNKVDMVVVAGPTSVYVSEEGNEGLTGTVTLATSHASIHIWDNQEPSLFQFDIYSCKQFDIETVVKHLDEMELVSYDYIMIDRNNGLSITDSGSKKTTTY